MRRLIIAALVVAACDRVPTVADPVGWTSLDKFESLLPGYCTRLRPSLETLASENVDLWGVKIQARAYPWRLVCRSGDTRVVVTYFEPWGRVVEIRQHGPRPLLPCWTLPTDVVGACFSSLAKNAELGARRLHGFFVQRRLEASAPEVAIIGPTYRPGWVEFSRSSWSFDRCEDDAPRFVNDRTLLAELGLHKPRLVSILRCDFEHTTTSVLHVDNRVVGLEMTRSEAHYERDLALLNNLPGDHPFKKVSELTRNTREAKVVVEGMTLVVEPIPGGTRLVIRGPHL